jgi:hypothetical protein
MSQLLKLVEFTLASVGAKPEDPVVLKLQCEEILNSFKLETQTKVEKDVQSWIDQWVVLFPPDITSGGVPLQSEASDCFDKMVKFIKRTKYTKEDIFKATEAYLEERGMKNFAYTKAAHYFIDKRGEGSLLAAWCKKVLSDDFEGVETELPDDGYNFI